MTINSSWINRLAMASVFAASLLVTGALSASAKMTAPSTKTHVMSHAKRDHQDAAAKEAAQERSELFRNQGTSL